MTTPTRGQAGPRTLRRLYRVARPLLFLLEAEYAHGLTLSALARLLRYPGARAWVRQALSVPEVPTELMGLRLPNPVGLAAGMDKNGRYWEALSCLGFGWLELGTVTPRPQPGNPKPRLFRLPGTRSLINRMGFNNAGVEALIPQIPWIQDRPILGINIGKNRDTAPAHAVDDYVRAFCAVAPQADYVTLNVSSPNTPGLRDLQAEAALEALLVALKAAQTAVAEATGRHVPLALKLAPDLDDAALALVARQCVQTGIEAIIATNTTVQRSPETLRAPAGGLSGPPLRPLAILAQERLQWHLAGRLPVIAVGGIDSAETAWARLEAGARAVQIYTGLIYEGPTLVADIVRGLHARAQANRPQARAPAESRPWSEAVPNKGKNHE